MKRQEHLFQFSATAIEQAAANEASYHEERIIHWRERAAAALARVEETIGAKVIRQPVSGGGEQVTIAIDYGDKTAWDEYLLADRKVQTHRDAATMYRVEQRLYGSQGTRVYEIDAGDVAHFRLGGEPRED